MQPLLKLFTDRILEIEMVFNNLLSMNATPLRSISSDLDAAMQDSEPLRDTTICNY
jgi:hypothetical protein